MNEEELTDYYLYWLDDEDSDINTASIAVD